MKPLIGTLYDIILKTQTALLVKVVPKVINNRFRGK